MEEAPHSITVLAPGEDWEFPALARTRHSLLLEGFQSCAYTAEAGQQVRPLSYGDVLRRLLEDHHTGNLLIVPAGMIVTPGFGAALHDCLLKSSPAASPPATGLADLDPTQQRAAMLLLRRLDAESSIWLPIPAEVSRFMHDLPIQRGNSSTPLPQAYARGRSVRRPAGENTYQVLAHSQPQRLERKVDVLDQSSLQAADSGWVYRCNNEPLAVRLHSASQCDAVVAVAAGIKPWHFANQLSAQIRHLVIVDSQLPQLGFAYSARARFREAATWSEICNSLPYQSIDDEYLLPSHEPLFQEIKANEQTWNFDIHYVSANILVQTFGLLSLLHSLNIARPLLWYSNIFQPYHAFGHSEHHVGMEFSFTNLVRSHFPGAVLFNAGTRPVADPRRQKTTQGLLFRARRFLDQQIR